MRWPALCSWLVLVVVGCVSAGSVREAPVPHAEAIALPSPAQMREAGPTKHSDDGPRVSGTPPPALQQERTAGTGNGAPGAPETRRSPPITVALDPGHGGPEPGAYNLAADLVEKELNLRVALELAAMLREAGFRVVLTRDADRAVSPDYVQWGVEDQVLKDLQARIDIANSAKADLFLSIHHNGAASPYKRGVEVWYNRDRPFADRNERLATLVRDHIVRALESAGYGAVDGGVLYDSEFDRLHGDLGGLYVLGPGTGEHPHTPTLMPGILSETLYLTHPEDAAALGRPETLTAIARGTFRAVLDYAALFPDTGQRWPIVSAAEPQRSVEKGK